MIIVRQVKLDLLESEERLEEKLRRKLHLSPLEKFSFKIDQRSLDLRKKPYHSYSLIVDIKNEKRFLKLKDVEIYKPFILDLKKKDYSFTPIIIGYGPSGIFANYLLNQAGFKPIVIERGGAIKKRVKDVENFLKTGELNEESNIQFGEGGAGTFSDAKLTTRIKDPLTSFIVDTLIKYGAPQTIRYDHHPHIGTDVLRQVVRGIRERIRSRGGEVRFRSRVAGLICRDGRLLGLVLSDGQEIEAQAVILAVGHSARELFFELSKKQIHMEPKAFAVGLRIQHPQADINLSQYGLLDPGKLGPAPYKLTAKASNGRGVYSFCMCPGGYVVNASSEPGRLAVNGMSDHKRDGKNANSALIVTITPEDFGRPGPLGGVYFQRELEERAFLLGQGNIPVQLYGDFRENRLSSGFGAVGPEFCGNTAFGDLRSLLPEALNQAFLEGMEQFGKKIRNFDRPDAIFAGATNFHMTGITPARE